MRLSQHHTQDPLAATCSPSPSPTPPSSPRARSAGRRLALAVSVLALASLPTTPAQAQGTNGTSTGYGVGGYVRFVPFSGSGRTLDFGRVAESTDQAPPSFLTSNAESSLEAAFGSVGKILCTSTLTSAASGTVDTSQYLSSRTDVDALELFLAGSSPLVTLTVQAVSAEASMAGPCGDSLSAGGSTTLTGAVMGGSLGEGLTVPSHPDPNTLLFDQDGIKIVLNERLLTGSGFGDLRITVNAIHVELNEVLIPGVGLLYGEIIIGHAEAELTCGDEL